MKKLLSALLSLAMLAALATVPAAAAYSDVPSGSALAAEVQKAVNYGLMNGYSATTFGYSDPMTRAQFVTVLDRMLLPQDGDETLMGHITSAMQVDYQTVRAYYSSIDAAAEHDWVDTDEPFRPSTGAEERPGNGLEAQQSLWGGHPGRRDRSDHRPLWHHYRPCKR